MERPYPEFRRVVALKKQGGCISGGRVFIVPCMLFYFLKKYVSEASMTKCSDLTKPSGKGRAFIMLWFIVFSLCEIFHNKKSNLEK